MKSIASVNVATQLVSTAFVVCSTYCWSLSMLWNLVEPVWTRMCRSQWLLHRIVTACDAQRRRRKHQDRDTDVSDQAAL